MSSAAALQVGGALVPTRHVYITRPEDELLFNLLLERQFCNVLTSRQMGKSSLMYSTALRLREHGVSVSTMDVAGSIGNEPNQELAWQTLLNKVARDLKINCEVRRWWREQTEETSNQKLLSFFRDVVCVQIQGPVVVFLDEIDSTLRLPYGDDLFTALRTIYNERATEDAYTRLAFCLVGVATPNELVRDRRTTAYNIGTTIALRDFDEERDDLSPLLATLGPNANEALPLLRRILYWTGGHPYLTTRFCRALAGKTVADIDALVESSYGDLSELRTDDHFLQIVRFFDDRLKGDAALESLAILERIVRGKTVVDKSTEAHAQLKLSGVVKANRRSELVIRNRLYGRVFDREWLQNLLPRKKLAWLRRVAAAAILALIALAVLFYAYARIFLPRQAAEAYLRRFDDERISLRDAKDYRAILTGERLDAITGRRLGGYEAEANVAYEKFSKRWVDARLKIADEMLSRGEAGDALVLAAYVAQESGQPLAERFAEEYEVRGYDNLVTTLRSSSEFWPGLAVSPDGHNVAVGNVWWVEKGDTWIDVKLDNATSINTVAFGPDGRLYTGDDDGAITEWEFDATGKIANKPVTVIGGRPRVLDLTIERDGRPAVIATGEMAYSLKLSDQVIVLTTSEPSGSIAVAPDGMSIVTTAGGLLSSWRRNRPAARYRAGEGIAFRDVAVGDDGMIAVAEPRAVALLRQSSTITQVQSIPHVPPVRSVALWKNLLATASDEGARVFDALTCRDLHLALGEGRQRRGSNVLAVAFDAAQNRLIVRRREAVEIWSLSGKSDIGATRLDQWKHKFRRDIANDWYPQ